MFVVLSIDDTCDYPFSTEKVMKVNKQNEEVVSIEVHWYATDTHPFDGVYKAEMVVEKKVAERETERVKK